MKKIILLAACSVLLFVSCGKKGSEQKEEDSQAKEQAMDMSRSSKQVIEWVGEYEGVLPCADCSGIKTKVLLNEDGTFEKSEEYLEKENGFFESKGTFSWDETESVITLKDEKENTQSYKVGEGCLILLDAEGKEVTGELADDYILAKVEVLE